jgi:hypothetical protein
MKLHEFEFIVNTSNVDHKECKFEFEGIFITYFKLVHACGDTLIGRAGGDPKVYDIVAREGDCTSVKIVQPKDVLVYIKRIFYGWEEHYAKKSTIS